MTEGEAMGEPTGEPDRNWPANCKYPDILVKLTDINGNVINLVGKVSAALRENNVPAEEIVRFRKEALGGTYDNVLLTIMKWVDVE